MFLMYLIFIEILKACEVTSLDEFISVMLNEINFRFYSWSSF